MRSHVSLHFDHVTKFQTRNLLFLRRRPFLAMLELEDIIPFLKGAPPRVQTDSSDEGFAYPYGRDERYIIAYLATRADAERPPSQNAWQRALKKSSSQMKQLRILPKDVKLYSTPYSLWPPLSNPTAPCTSPSSMSAQVFRDVMVIGLGSRARHNHSGLY